MPLRIQLTLGSSNSIWKQIVDQVRLGVARGELVAGEQMPSVRSLAEQLVVNPNTVARAYTELTQAGVLVSVMGKGNFVAESRETYTHAERLRRVESAVLSLATEGVGLGFSPDELAELIRKRAQALMGDRKE
jgi:GntR family transcriptional regulator